MTRRLIKILDGLWREAIKLQAGNKCEFCGAPRHIKPLHAHHVIPRTNYRVRWEPLNGVALCYRCHMHWAHKDATAFTAWFKQLVGSARYRRLQKMRQEYYDSTIRDFSYYKGKLKNVGLRGGGNLGAALATIRGTRR